MPESADESNSCTNQEYVSKSLKTKTMSLQQAFEISQHQDPEWADIVQLANKYIEDNLISLSKQPEFMAQTTAECMGSFLETYYFDNTANISASERKEMFQIVSGWINNDLEQRNLFAIIYLKRFKLGLLPSDSLQKALDDGIAKIPECKTTLEEVIAIQTNSDNLTVPLSYITHPHWFSVQASKTMMIHIGGKHMANQSIKYWRETRWDTLYSIPKLPQKIRHHSIVVVNGHLCVAGGMGQSQGRYKGFSTWLSSFYQYDSFQHTWKSLASMTTARANFALVHINYFIYAIGGDQHGSALTDVECYSLTNKSWQSIAPLAVGVIDPSAITYGGKILVYGKKVCSANRYVLQILSPDMTKSNPRGNWSIALDDQQHATRSTNTPKYVLTVQNDKIYRITYEDTNDKKQMVCVTELQCDFDHEPPRVYIGATEDQSHLHTIITSAINTSAGRNIFSINRELYANVLGCIYKMGITDSKKEVGNNRHKLQHIELEDNTGGVTLQTVPE
ncbi:kelch-like protein 15 [Amphiura filiformis]|uniref:kelch-like protein 15 n=1 Tax=Amphiura filiformis TaxID=82378 RepID=UPI003B2281A2